jgi:hypothetical protein
MRPRSEISSLAHQAKTAAPAGQFSTMEAQLEVGPEPFSQTLEIGLKFQAAPYRLKYTIAENGPPRVIVDAEDLRSFGTHQSEYIELRTLSDVTAWFPSISKLYFGVVSRTVVVIPNRYVILRNSGVCAALCNAPVDSSPGLNVPNSSLSSRWFRTSVLSISFFWPLKSNPGPTPNCVALASICPRPFNSVRPPD